MSVLAADKHRDTLSRYFYIYQPQAGGMNS